MKLAAVFAEVNDVLFGVVSLPKTADLAPLDMTSRATRSPPPPPLSLEVIDGFRLVDG